MNIQKNKKYIIRFLIHGNLLTYNCTVTDIDADSITFIDIKGDTITYKLDYIVGYQEIDDFKQSFYKS